jgi:4-hydroxybenzoyl-CoA reductase subunit beta
MMRLPEFRYRAPASVAEACAILHGEGPSARVLAGGTDLLPNMKRRHQQAATLVALARVPELRGIDVPANGGGETRVGAMTSLGEICADQRLRARHPGFVRAVASISAPALRNAGTISGNLCLDTRCIYYNQDEAWRRAISYCMKEQGEVCWVAPGSPRCWAIAASDAAPLLCAVGARVRLVSVDGDRVIPLPDLYRDDGIAYLTKRPDELLTEVLLPEGGGWRLEAGGWRDGGRAAARQPGASESRMKATYWKLRRRGSIDFPVLGVGAAIWTDAGGLVTRASIVLGAVASAPLPCDEAAALLVGRPLDPETIAAAAKAARRMATPLDNTDFTIAWRGAMAEKYVDGALRELAGLPEKARPPRHGAWAFAER